MAISIAEYDIITKIVDKRMEMYNKRLDEIKVEREDFNELKKEVATLTKNVNLLVQAQARTEERTGRLEQAVEKLAQAQTRTEEKTGRLEQAVEKLAQAQAKTEQTLEQLCKNVGRLSDTIGFGLEDIAKIVVPGYLERHTDIRMIEEFDRNFVEVDGKEIEVDLWAEYSKNGKTVLVIGEAKSKIYEGEVKKFLFNIVEPIRKKEKDMEIYPFMFGYVLHPSAKKMAQEAGIHLIASYQR